MTTASIFPVTSSPLFVFLAFACLLGTFHWLLVRRYSLSKLGWKRVDYLWLGFSVLGLLGAAADVRKTIGEPLTEASQRDVDSAYDDLRSYLGDMSNCKKVSPGLSESEKAYRKRNYDRTCAFASAAHSKLPLRPPEYESLEELLKDRPSVSESEMTDAFTLLDFRINDYSKALRRLGYVRGATRRSPIERGLAVVGPLLLSLALALRITKVTGEIRLET
jgi:hypothetical protein